MLGCEGLRRLHREVDVAPGVDGGVARDGDPEIDGNRVVPRRARLDSEFTFDSNPDVKEYSIYGMLRAQMI